jgi:hypothetical protein
MDKNANQGPLTNAQLGGFFSQIQKGDEEIVRVQEDLRKIVAAGADSKQISDYCLSQGLVGLDINKFLAADTLDKRLNCMLDMVGTSGN